MPVVKTTLFSSGNSLVASHVVSAASALVEEVICTNTSASVLYCQVFNLAALPSDAVQPDFVFAVPATSTASWDAQQGINFDTGVVVCVSSTAHTKTIAGAVAVFNTILEQR
jgi:hypothetical protein